MFNEKITRHTKKQESMTHSRGKKLSLKKMYICTYKLDKDFKTSILKMLKELIKYVEKAKKK